MKKIHKSKKHLRRKSHKKHAKKHTKKYSRKNKCKCIKNGKSRRNKCKYGKVCKKNMRGGSVNGPVGYAWDGGNASTWPGVKGGNNGATMSNHFKVSPNGIVVGGIEPARSTSENFLTDFKKGGSRRKRKHHKSHQKGGFFQEIVNLGRGGVYDMKNGYYDLIGKGQPMSQNPYPQEQPIDQNFKFIGSAPVDVPQVYIDANREVAST